MTNIGPSITIMRNIGMRVRPVGKHVHGRIDSYEQDRPSRLFKLPHLCHAHTHIHTQLSQA